MTLDDIIMKQGTSARAVEDLVHSAMASGEGRSLLRLLCQAVPPMCPSISDTGPNDAHAVGMREGRREVVAFLFRFSRASVEVLNPVQPT